MTLNTQFIIFPKFLINNFFFIFYCYNNNTFTVICKHELVTKRCVPIGNFIIARQMVVTLAALKMNARAFKECK